MRIVNVGMYLLANLCAGELQHGMGAPGGHVQVSVKTRFLNRKSIFHSSTELHQFVETEGKQSLAEAKEKNLNYDKQTDNGATQGSRLRLK